MTKTLLLDCGSGGRASQRLINELFLEQFDNPILRTLDDAAKLELSGPIAMSTDGYTVTPLFFPGGNIGTLAVHGTVNDVSMLGARRPKPWPGSSPLTRKKISSPSWKARSAPIRTCSPCSPGTTSIRWHNEPPSPRPSTEGRGYDTPTAV